MGFWDNAAAFVTGFLDGVRCQAGRAAYQNDAPLGAPHLRHDRRPGFPEYAQALARSAGFPLLTLEDDNAAFQVDCDGEEYILSLFLLRGGEAAVLMAHSKVRFRPHCMPGPVLEVMEQMNRKERHWQYDVVRGEEAWRACVQTVAAVEDVTPEAFAFVGQKLVVRALAFDRTLVDYGFAR